MGRRRSLRPAPRRIGATAALGILGVAVWLGLSLTPPTAIPETGPVLMGQALWRNPMPSILAAGGIISEAPGARRGLVPTEPPRALGVPSAPKENARASAVPPGIPVRVYFSRRPDSESSFSAVFPVSRVAADRAVATAALAALIEGPTAAERAAGYYSELGAALTGASNCSGRDFRLAIEGGTATARFCRPLVSAGVGQDARMRSQIEATLRQFPTIGAVRLLGSDGHCLFDPSGQDRCLSGQATSFSQGVR